MSESKSESPSRGSDESEVDEEQLRGDAIGETLYSGKWVLQTVMNLVKEFPKYTSDSVGNEGLVELEPSLEDDLSTLWDMTTNKDVILFLLSNDFPSIVTSLLPTCVAPRLSEICIGIIGNMICEAEVFEQFCKEVGMIDVIQEYLRNSDAQCVLQSVRFFTAFSFHCTEESILILAKRNSLWNSICFVLQNSLNEELLHVTLNFLHSLLEKTVTDSTSLTKDEIPVSDLTRGIFESMQVSLPSDLDGFEDLPREVHDKIRWSVQSLFKLSSLNGSSCESIVRENIQIVVSLLRLFLLELLETKETAGIVNNCYEALTLWATVVDHSPQLFVRFAQLGFELMNIDIDDEEFRALQVSYSKKFATCFQSIVAKLTYQALLDLLDSTHTDHSFYSFQCLRKWAPCEYERLKNTGRESGRNKIVQLIQTLEQDEHS